MNIRRAPSSVASDSRPLWRAGLAIIPENPVMNNRAPPAGPRVLARKQDEPASPLHHTKWDAAPRLDRAT